MNNMLYLQTIKNVRDSVGSEKRTDFDLNFTSREKNPTTAFLLSIFLGMLGVDRFYIGQTGRGLLKLFTVGGFTIVAIVDLFLIIGATRDKNIELAEEAKRLVA